MKGFLLDVNAVVALAYDFHVGHEAMRQWYATHRTVPLFLCPVVEMGFLRVSLHGRYRDTIILAQDSLTSLSRAAGFGFLTDDTQARTLPTYVKTAREVRTDICSPSPVNMVWSSPRLTAASKALTW